jgi:hypothetical protein
MWPRPLGGGEGGPRPPDGGGGPRAGIGGRHRERWRHQVEAPPAPRQRGRRRSLSSPSPLLSDEGGPSWPPVPPGAGGQRPVDRLPQAREDDLLAAAATTSCHPSPRSTWSADSPNCRGTAADPAKAGSSHGWRGRPPSVARPAPRGGAAGPKGWRDLWSAPRGGVAGSDRRLPSALGSLSPLSDLSLDSSLSLSGIFLPLL